MLCDSKELWSYWIVRDIDSKRLIDSWVLKIVGSE